MKCKECDTKLLIMSNSTCPIQAVRNQIWPWPDWTERLRWLAVNCVLQVTWSVPVVDDSGSRSHRPCLTKISRCQRFLTYLVMQSTNLPSSSLHHEGCHLRVLKAVSWSVEVNVSVDPSKPLGKRVTFIGPARQQDPEIIDAADAPSLTDNALRPPNANSSQMLTWWPADVNKNPTVVVKPRVTTLSVTRAIQTYQHAHSRHARRLHSLYCFSSPHWCLWYCKCLC